MLQGVGLELCSQSVWYGGNGLPPAGRAFLFLEPGFLVIPVSPFVAMNMFISHHPLVVGVFSF